MYCPSCNAYNPDNTAFCSKCSATLPPTLPTKIEASRFEMHLGASSGSMNLSRQHASLAALRPVNSASMTFSSPHRYTSTCGCAALAHTLTHA